MITATRFSRNKAQELASGYFKMQYGFETPAGFAVPQMPEKGSMEFLLLGFAWAKNFGDAAKEQEYYSAMRSLMQQENDTEETANYSEQELAIASACVDTMQVFHVAHEIALLYRAACGMTDSDEASEAAAADELAYRVLLGAIADDKKEEEDLTKPSYLAPMMYVDYLDLMGYTGRILSDEKSYENTHRIAKARKARLFEVLRDKPEGFDTAEGDRLYSGIQQIYDVYKIKLLLEEK